MTGRQVQAVIAPRPNNVGSPSLGKPSGVDTAVKSDRRAESRLALERLAARTHRPVELVRELYQRELDRLEREARIARFLPLIALRHVREMLRHDTAQ
jgi:hypothetical protein